LWSWVDRQLKKGRRRRKRRRRRRRRRRTETVMPKVAC
jgi:hypothetical protein